jgi:hypothetical protein
MLVPDSRPQLQYNSCPLIESSKIFLHKVRACIRVLWTFILVSELNQLFLLCSVWFCKKLIFCLTLEFWIGNFRSKHRRWISQLQESERVDQCNGLSSLDVQGDSILFGIKYVSNWQLSGFAFNPDAKLGIPMASCFFRRCVKLPPFPLLGWFFLLTPLQKTS